MIKKIELAVSFCKGKIQTYPYTDQEWDRTQYMDPLCEPGSWTVSIKVWNRFVNPVRGPFPWSPYFTGSYCYSYSGEDPD